MADVDDEQPKTPSTPPADDPDDKDVSFTPVEPTIASPQNASFDALAKGIMQDPLHKSPSLRMLDHRNVGEDHLNVQYPPALNESFTRAVDLSDNMDGVSAQNSADTSQLNALGLSEASPDASHHGDAPSASQADVSQHGESIASPVLNDSMLAASEEGASSPTRSIEGHPRVPWNLQTTMSSNDLAHETSVLSSKSFDFGETQSSVPATPAAVKHQRFADENRDLAQEVQRLTADCQSLQAAIRDWEQKYDNLSDAHATLENESEEKVRAAVKRAAEMSAEAKEAGKRATKLEQELKKAEFHLSELQEKNGKLQRQYEECSRELAEAQARASALEDQAVEAQAKANAMEERLKKQLAERDAALQEALKATEEKAQRLKQELESKRSLDSEIKLLKDELECERNDRLQLMQKLEDMQNDKDMDSRFRDGSSIGSISLDDIHPQPLSLEFNPTAELQTEITQLKGQVEMMQRQLQATDDALKSEQSTAAAAKQLNAQHEERIQQLQHDLQAATEKLTALEDALVAAKAESAARQQQMQAEQPVHLSPLETSMEVADLQPFEPRASSDHPSGLLHAPKMDQRLNASFDERSSIAMSFNDLHASAHMPDRSYDEEHRMGDTEYKKLHDELDKANKRIQQDEDKIKSLTEHVELVKTQREQDKAKMAETQQAIEQQKKAEEAAVAAKHEISQANVALKTENQTLTNANKTLTEQTQKLKDDLEALQRKLSKLEANIKHLQETNKKIEADKSAAADQLKKATAELANAKADLAKAKADLTTDQHTVAGLQDKIRQLEDDKRSALQQLKSRTADVEKLTADAKLQQTQAKQATAIAEKPVAPVRVEASKSAPRVSLKHVLMTRGPLEPYLVLYTIVFMILSVLVLSTVQQAMEDEMTALQVMRILGVGLGRPTT